MNSLTRIIILLTAFNYQTCHTAKIAVIGEGVIGLSTAMAITDMDKTAEVHIYHHKPFEKILSRGIAGLFRIDSGTPLNRIYGNDTFVRLAELWRQHGGLSGVQMVSGHILSYDKSKLDMQLANYGDIVYNFRFLDKREMKSQFVLPEDDNSSAIHYTAFTSEGLKYCPWMKGELLKRGVKFHQKTLTTAGELADEGYSTVVNCGGLNGASLADDGDTKSYPIRGVLLKVNAPWQKHFLYRDFGTITIPTIDSVYVGTVKQDRKDNLDLTQEDIDDIWNRYTELQPAFKNVTITDYFVGLRPGRESLRVDTIDHVSKKGTKFKLVNNYGHGGNGFTLAWGTALHAATLALNKPLDRYADANKATVAPATAAPAAAAPAATTPRAKRR